MVRQLLRRPGRGQVVRGRRRGVLRPRAPKALEELRWALDGGHRRRCWSPRRSPAAPAGWPATWARRAGCARPTWPARSACRRGSCARSATSPAAGPTGGIARAIRAIAQADADIKGAASDAAYTLERMVLTVTAADGSRLRRRGAARTLGARPQRPARSAQTTSGRALRASRGGRARRRADRRASVGQSEAARLAIADLRLAAWFLWMTPLEAALSSLRRRRWPASTAVVLVAGVGGLAELADGGLQAGLDGLVALVRLLVLLVALDLGLDVRHWCAFGRSVVGAESGARRSGGRTRDRQQGYQRGSVAAQISSGRPPLGASQAQPTSPCQRWCVAQVRRGRRHRLVAAVEEVPGDQREHDVDRARPGRRAGSGRVGEHRVDVEAVAARPISRNDGVQPGRARRPASSSRTATRCPSAVEQQVVVADVGVDERVAPRSPRRSAAASAAASSRCGQVRAGSRQTWSQYAGAARANSSANGSSASPARRRGELARRASRARQARRRGRPARHGRRGRPAVDVLEPEHHPVVRRATQSSRGAGTLGRERGELAGLLAVGLGEHPLRLRSRPP